MFFATVLQQYLVWHYGQALVLYIRIYRNFHWFIHQFFSINQLARSLFTPFRRIIVTPTRRFDIGEWASALIINLLSRLLGALIRLLLIATGMLALISLAFISVIGFTFWLAAPLLTVGTMCIGGYFIFTSLI